MTGAEKNIRCVVSKHAVETLKQIKAKTGINQTDIIGIIMENIDVEIGMLLVAPALEQEEVRRYIAHEERTKVMREEVKELLQIKLESLEPAALRRVKSLLAKS